MPWNHLIYEAILVVIVIVGYHLYYRSQWQSELTSIMYKVMKQVERSSWQQNVLKTNDYHGNIAEHYTRDTMVSL